MNPWSRTTRLRIPIPILVVAGLVLLMGAVITVVGAYAIGVTWDEKTNMLSLQNFFDQGWNITADAILDGQPNPDYIWGIYVYGPISLLLTHALASLAGAESWGQVAFTADAYAWRHVGGAIIGLVGICAAGLIVRVVTASWRWALIGAAMLAVIPMWTGHSMMNIKDGPVGTGYTIATLGLVLVMRQDYLGRRWVRWAGLSAVFAGAFLAAGTRAASGVPIAGSVVLAAVVWWLVMRRDPGLRPREAFRGALRRLIEAGLALAVTYGALVLAYPNVWRNPFTLAYQAVVVSAKFPFDEPILFAGTWVDQPVPWTYLPGWFLAQLPLLVVVGVAGFVIVWAWQAVRAALGREPGIGRATLVEMSPVLLQALLLPVIAVVVQTTMYNAVRQFVFVVPAAAVLATLGVWAAFRWMDGRHMARGWTIGAWSLVGLGLLVPAVSQLLLYPYAYTYYNAATALRSIDNTWPTDYWRASSNELMRRLPVEGPESCAYEQTRKGQAMPCSDQPMFEPYLDQRGADAQRGMLEPGQYWLVRENQGRATIPQGCVVFDEVTRPLFWQTITIGQILRCDADALIPANGDPPL